MKTLYIVDLMNTTARSLSVNQNLFHNHKSTGGVFGFLTQIISRMKTLDPTDFIVCKDRRPYIREKIYPDYKNRKNRESSNSLYADLNENIISVQRLLEIMNIPLWEIEGLEADDLIAQLVFKYHSEYDEIYIQSNDSDLYQLFNTATNIMFFKQKSLYGIEDFKKEYSYLDITQWVSAQALAGTHNAVEGIKGIGLKTAAKILNDLDLTEKMMNVHKDIFERNLELIKLPCPLYTGDYDNPSPARPKCEKMSLLQFLNEHGITFTQVMENTLAKFFFRRNPSVFVKQAPSAC